MSADSNLDIETNADVNTDASPDASPSTSQEGQLPRGALSSIRVLDMSRVLAGPWAGQTLADLGADVIKIERPSAGDDTRTWGPPFAPDANGDATTESAYFLSANRNKRSLTVDIASADGQALIRQLAASSDVVLENYKVGTLDRYGIGYQALSEINPRLIYCAITGFGQSGPYAGRAGYDFMIQGLGGLMSVTGRADGEPGEGPQKVGVALIDLLTGMYASTAVLAALHARQETGRGQFIDLALLDVQVACLGNQALNYLSTGKAPGRLGNGHPNIVPYQDFKTADGSLIIAVGNDSQFRALCDVLGASALGDDARYRSNAGRVAHRDTLLDTLSALIATHLRDDLLAALEGRGVPAGPINTIDQVFDDPQVRAREIRLDLPHPSAGTVPSVASPIRMTETPVAYRRAPPMLGQHTDEILRDTLGLDAAAIATLRERGTI